MTQILSTIAPYAFILVCPLMMIFMMKGMHGKSHQEHTQDDIDQLKVKNAQLTKEIDNLKRNYQSNLVKVKNTDTEV